MKTYFKIILLLCLFSINAQSQSDWTLAKNDQQIQIYTRNIQGSKIKEFKAITIIKGDIDKILDMLINFEGYSKWIDGCESGSLLKKLNSGKFVYHIQLSLPWPLKNRDAVIEATLSKDNNGIINLAMTENPTFIKAKADYVRMPKFRGKWVLTPKNNGFVQVEQQIHAEPGGSIPAWVANSKVTDGPLATFVNLKNKMAN
ncbi:START domain-containing protein [Flavobacterium sp. H122]|uniref:START domain-containing protein n=1 Tax=Flavobacterium sp. H122 TaxID=2529860 RepID=UPI0010A9C65C|nr:START domain-containing protein [Flavobacterium sp. H122]